MPEKPSRSVQETRDKEAWLVHLLDGDAAGREELAPLLATASLVRAAADQIEAPSGVEESARERALAEMNSVREHRQPASPARAPWLVRFGSAMRFVFTLGRRR
jgi:hypothetical protein